MLFSEFSGFKKIGTEPKSILEIKEARKEGENFFSQIKFVKIRLLAIIYVKYNIITINSTSFMSHVEYINANYF